LIMINGSWTPVPILMYHDLELQPRERKYKHFYVVQKDFEWQMRSLMKAGYTPISFDQLGAGISGKAVLPEKPILLTFDDGYRNVLTLAHPILASLKMKFTVFIVSGKIGKTNDWVISEGYETSPLMTWDEIIELRSTSLADIQAHTVTHRRLSKLGPPELADELQMSKAAIEAKLGAPVNTICYPYGDYDDKVVEASKLAGYTYGVTTDFGRVRKDDNILKMPRVSIHHVPFLSLDYGVSTLNYWWKIKSRVDRRD